MKRRKCKISHEEVIRLYNEDTNIKTIQEMAGISRQSIYNIIKVYQDTDRRGVWDMVCPHCLKDFKRIQALAKGDKSNYCSIECFHADRRINSKDISLEFSVRTYRSRARQVLEGAGRVFQVGEVVHHLDGDITNNVLENLVVLPSHSEHMRLYHH